MLNVAINGAMGRLGKEIINIIEASSTKYRLVFAKVREAPEDFMGESIFTCEFKTPSSVDVLIDFSNAESTLQSLAWCLEYKIPLVIGTSGFTSLQIEKIKAAATQIPILQSANMSLSVNVLYKVCEIVAKTLRNYEVEITESHHRYKKDSPSGTALSLGEVIAASRGFSLEQVAKFDRSGTNNSVRDPDEIGFSVIRGGDIVGRHTVSFIADGEELNFTSMINNRGSFAAGALLAAQFLAKCKPGYYTMEDALNLKNL